MQAGSKSTVSATGRSAPAGAFDLGRGQATALLWHGYAGGPDELRPLGEALARAGLRAIGPWLAGHGGSSERLASVDAGQLRQRVQRDAAAIDGPLLLCGFSLGALLATAVAVDNQRVRALVLLAPAVRLAGVGQLGIAGARLGLWRSVPAIPNLVGADVGGRRQRRLPIWPERVPLRPLIALHQLARECLELLPRVHVPTLIAHGRRDRVVPVAAARQVAAVIGSRALEVHLLRDSHHQLTLDRQADLLADLVVRFARRWL